MIARNLFARLRPGTATATAAPAAAGPGRRATWQAWARAFDARAPRERMLLAAAGVAAAFMLADAVWLQPALRTWDHAQAQRKTQATQGAELASATLQAQIAQEQQRLRQQTTLDQTRLRVQDGERLMREFESTLVGPEQMLPLLEQMLARHGQVRVREMKPLGRADLLLPPGAAVPAPATNPPTTPAGQPPPTAQALAPAAAASAAGGGVALPGLYRHGVELTLEGSFADLMGYVAALEEMPQRMLWGGMSFRVEQHPRAVLTLRLYTLSTSRHWIAI